MTALLDDLARFTAVPAPPGREEALAVMVAERWSTAGPVAVDGLGNRRMTVGSGGPHIAMSAHLDEVGVMISRIDDQGYLGLHRLGGVPERVLTMRRLQFLGAHGLVPGVVGTPAHHLTPDSAKYRVPTVDEVYVDVGASSRDQVTDELGLRVGDHGVYDRSFHREGDRVFCNALDDRAGLAALSSVADALAARPPATRTSLVASVQEEFNVRGSIPTIRRLNPQVLIAVDVSPATDTPDLAGQRDLNVGGGPVVHLHSFHGRGTLGGVIPPAWLVGVVEAVAEREGLPLQRASFFGGLTDGSFAQLEGDGIPTIEIGIPVRYTHSPMESCSVADLEALVVLLEGLARHDWKELPEVDG